MQFTFARISALIHSLFYCASWLNSVLFWVLKAAYGLLATLDSIGYRIYSLDDIINQNLGKISLRKGRVNVLTFKQAPSA